MAGVRPVAPRRRPLGAARALGRAGFADAALHIGPQHVVLETAAIDMAAELVGTEMLQMQAWHVMFLARGKVGPFRVEGGAVRGTAGKVGARMVLHERATTISP